MIRTFTQMHCTDKYLQYSLIIWDVWLNGWVFVYKLRGCGFSNKEFLVIQSTIECGLTLKRAWHDKSIQSNSPYRYLLKIQANHLATLAKWLSVHLRTKWLCFRVQLQCFELQIYRLFRARSYLTFRQL